MREVPGSIPGAALFHSCISVVINGANESESSGDARQDMWKGTDNECQEQMDTLGFEPRAFRMRSGCDTTTPCAPCGFRNLRACRITASQSLLAKKLHPQGVHRSLSTLGKNSILQHFLRNTSPPPPPPPFPEIAKLLRLAVSAGAATSQFQGRGGEGGGGRQTPNRPKKHKCSHSPHKK